MPARRCPAGIKVPIMTVLVTGGAGYIGSHAVRALRGAGVTTVVLDDLSTGHAFLVPHDVPLIQGNIRQKDVVEDIIGKFDVDSVIHFAASIVVPDSVERPLDYYENNVANSLHLIEACVAGGVQQFVFSSSAAVYGQPETVPVSEDAPPSPENPYGATKLMTEWMLRDTAAAHGMRFAALRYFNVAGADPSGLAGQVSHNSTHLIKVACEVALGLRPEISIYGTDYPTPDGTCIRDYIHVSDLADIHLLALRRLQEGADSFVLNCGYGRGYSVREVLSAVARVSGKTLNVREAAKRPGDPPALVANTDLLNRRLGWQPRCGGLDNIIETALDWERHMADAAFAIGSGREVQRPAARD
jgi:UDP-glucose 4-epimerase